MVAAGNWIPAFAGMTAVKLARGEGKSTRQIRVVS
jgi:hypothetical protein